MKRAIVFLLLGPALAVTTLLIYFAQGGGSSWNGAAIIGMSLLLFTLIVSVITGPVDGYLARVLPLTLRAALTAIVGAVISVSLSIAFDRMMFSHWAMPSQCELMVFAIGGALCMGVCSLLSNDYGLLKRSSHD